MKSIVTSLPPTHPFVIGIAEIAKLLLGKIVILENKTGRKCALIPARHIAASQPVSEPETHEFAVL